MQLQNRSISSSMLRRKYPQTLEGGKAEWRAMIDHLERAGEEASIDEGMYSNSKKMMQRDAYLDQLNLKQRNDEDLKSRRLKLENDIIAEDLRAMQLQQDKELSRKQLISEEFVSGNNAILQLNKKLKDQDVSLPTPSSNFSTFVYRFISYFLTSRNQRKSSRTEKSFIMML